MSRVLFSDKGYAKTYLDFHHGELIISSSQDVAPILDQNARLRSIEQCRHEPMRLAASVPMVDYVRWKREWKENHSDKWEWKTFAAMKLNSRDYGKMLTADMKL